MAIVMNAIYTQTVGAGGAGNITFNNIPQFYTDLLLKMSIRGSQNNVSNLMYMRFNNAGAAGSYSGTRLYGSGSSVSSQRTSGPTGDYLYGGYTPNESATSNTFSNNEVYIPNYMSSNFKQIIIDSGAENNDTSSATTINAALFLSTNPITSILVGAFGGLVQNSTVSLYGIIRPGA